MSEDHSSARGFGPGPLDIAYSAELGPNIVELNVHGTNNMENGNGVEDYGMQEKRNPEQPLGGQRHGG
jgi:hypothetical protein